MFNDREDYTKALEYYDKALEIRKEVFRENHPDLANSYQNMGLVHKNLNRYTKALEYYKMHLE